MIYDVCVIGSGLGGLEVALSLAQKGKSVVVLERQNQAGGCMQSFLRKGHRYDTGLHYIGGLRHGEVLYEEFLRLGLMDLPWVSMDQNCYEEVHVAGRKFCWPQGIDRFIARMKEYFPHETEGLDRYRELLLCDDVEFLQRTNAWEYLNSIIHDTLLVEVLSAPAMCKMELCKETVPLFTFVHCTTPFIEASFRLRGDGNLIVNRLVSQIRENGGEILTSKDVVELVEEDGRIVSARCTNGEEYHAQIFISDTHPSVTCNMVRKSALMKNVFRRRMTSQENTFGIFTVQLKLKPQSLKYFNHNKMLVTAPSCWDEAVDLTHEVRNIMISCRLPEEGENSEYTTNIDILTPMKWECVNEWADSCLGHRPKGYVDMKEDIARRCISLAQTLIPGLDGMIEQVWTSSPLTYRDYNKTFEGSAFGFRKDYNNPMMTIVSPRTPIPNLYMTGQSLMLHGLQGVTMTAGYTLSALQS